MTVSSKNMLSAEISQIVSPSDWTAVTAITFENDLTEDAVFHVDV